MLQAEYEATEQRLNAAEWTDLKDRLAGEMASSDFWSRPDRFATLARFALMDRVKSAAETANALRGRAARYSRSPGRYSAELCSRFALQLHLIREGIKDALEDAPVELALTIDPVFDGGGDRSATLAWCRNLATMYRAWAEKRRMQISDLPGAVNGGKPDTPILIVSGFGGPPRSGGGSGPSRLRAVRERGGPPCGACAHRPRTARRRPRRQGTPGSHGGPCRGGAAQHRGQTLSGTAAAGARCRREMAHRPPRSRARRRVRFAVGRCVADGALDQP